MKIPIFLLAIAAIPACASDPFKIEIVDEENGWPVPMVELTTTHNVTFITDNAGVVAVDLPELMGRETWFHLRSDGYELAPDGFGNRGFRATPVPGESERIEVKRTILAKRLGRLTGAGLFAESQKLGDHLEWQESGITGCDSVQIASHRGSLYWAWGDTNLPKYPLGIFHMSSATTTLNPLGTFRPPVKIKFGYFEDKTGAPRAVAKLPGDGPTWLSGYVSIQDKGGQPHLVASFAKIRGFLDAYRSGLCEWNEENERFDTVRVLWEKTGGSTTPPPIPDGHPASWTDHGGKRWLLFGDPFPKMKMPAEYEAWRDPSCWETLDPQALVPRRDGEAPIRPHRGSIAWNEFMQCWVTVFTELGGQPSEIGELWFATADHPTGPWGGAVKVLSHENYSFYNPRLHADFTPAGSPILLFEGTYTSLFSESESKTPRYDYNQILYRLDLDTPAFRRQEKR